MNDSNEQINNKFSFLPDIAIEDIKNDLLNHKSIAKTLKVIISSCQTPFTIGVFGKWGTGKSTIGKFLCDQIKNDDNLKNEVRVVEFDVWKYEKDSLRRQFLINIDQRLNLRNNFKETLNQDITRPKNLEVKQYLKLQLSSIAGKSVVGLAILFCLFFIIKVSNISSFLFQNDLIPEQIFNGLYDFSLFGLVVSFVLTSYVNIWDTVQTKKTDSAEGFEDVFRNEILGHKKLKNKKLLVIVDNLDRVSKEKAIEVLSTVKTFLELDRCIFIIQCDEQAIKKHLRKLYSANGDGDDYDADEYLRKFFNTYVQIPPFISSDLGVYTESLLNETNIVEFQNNDSLITLISTAFKDNPRQIKQFINTLIAHFLLARERESSDKDGILKLGSLTGNVALMAKLMLIKQYDPKFYESIVDDPNKFNDLSSPDLEKRVIELFQATPLVKAENNLRSFIYYKESDLSLKLEGVGESLKIALISNDSATLEQLKGEITSNNIEDREIRRFISNDIISDNSLKTDEIVNVINGLSKLKFEITKNFSDKIIQKISGYTHVNISALNLDYLSELLNKCTKDNRDTISHKFLSLVNLKGKDAATKVTNFEETSKRIFNIVIEDINKYQVIVPGIVGALESLYFDDADIFNKIHDNDLENTLISNTYISNLIASIAPANLKDQSFYKKINILNTIFNSFSDQNVFECFSKYHELLDEIRKQPNDDQRINIIEKLFGSFELFIQLHEEKIINHPKLEETGEYVYEITHQLQIEQKSNTLLSLFKLNSHMKDANRQARMQQEIFNFTEAASINSLKNVFSRINDRNELTKLISFVSSKLEPRAFNNTDFFLFYFNLISDNDSFLEKALISQNQDIALNLLHEGNISANSNDRIVKYLVENLFKIPGVDLKRKALEYIEKSSKKIMKDVREVNLSNIKKLLITENDEQILGLQFYKNNQNNFTKSSRVSFCSELIDWLEGQPSLNTYHINAIRTIVFSWDIISQTNQEKIYNILFDRLLGKSNEVSVIEDVGNLLTSLSPKPTYTKLSPHFDIVKARIEQMSDQQLKNALVEQFLKIKPNKYSDSNPFWSFIDKELSSYKSESETV